MPWAHPVGPCMRCGGAKPPGRGRRLCDSCERVPVWSGTTPCRSCGSTRGKRPKKQLCDECKALHEWRTGRRHAAKKVMARKPCLRCGGPKGPGRKRRLCDACRAKREALPLCRRCRQRSIRRRYAQLCEVCTQIAAERLREKHRVKSRERRVRLLEQERTRAREAGRRRRADPVVNARDLETKRLRYRLRAQQEGRHINGARHEEMTSGSWLPGYPLAAAIDRLAESSDLEAVCGLAGVDERLVTAWRRCERSPSLGIVDRVLTGLDLLWWDVWTEETVRVPVFVVDVYVSHVKKEREKRVRRRVLLRSVPYGDLGPDREKLAEIGALMTGEAVAA